jgi:hypothetical protein
VDLSREFPTPCRCPSSRVRPRGRQTHVLTQRAMLPDQHKAPAQPTASRQCATFKVVQSTPLGLMQNIELLLPVRCTASMQPCRVHLLTVRRAGPDLDLRAGLHVPGEQSPQWCASSCCLPVAQAEAEPSWCTNVSTAVAEGNGTDLRSPTPTKFVRATAKHRVQACFPQRQLRTCPASAS